MTQTNSDTSIPINEVDVGEDGEILISPTQTQNSGVGKEMAPRAAPSKPVTERRWRRKNDITTLHGLAREHARLIAAMHSGRMPLEDGDIMSRTYGRQRELVATNELKESVAQLAQQLADLKNDSGRVVSDQFPGGSIK